jgi:hypothetical protein
VARSGGDFDDIDWLDDGPQATLGPTAAPRLPWPRWFTVAVAVLVVAAVVAVLNTVRRTPPAAPLAAVATTPASSSRPAPHTTSVPRTSPAPSPVSVLRLGHPLLGITAGWELFARGSGVLARIQPAAGRVTLTTGADLRSSAPVSLLIGPDRVVIRSLDNVPGYLVPDDRPAVEVPLLGDQGGPVFPGPAAGQMWVPPADDQKQVMTLATLDGRRITGSHGLLEMPRGSFARDAVADGAGYLLFTGIGGVYDARPDGVRRITTGVLLAVGPTGWLVTECDDRYRCQAVLIGRADGSRRVVGGNIVDPYTRGVIAPDGSTAAIMTTGPNNTLGLSVIDFARNRRLQVRNLYLNRETFDGAVVYSPDSKWLFAATESGTITAIDPRTATATALDDTLPTVVQLAVRPARDH